MLSLTFIFQSRYFSGVGNLGIRILSASLARVSRSFSFDFFCCLFSSLRMIRARRNHSWGIWRPKRLHWRHARSVPRSIFKPLSQLLLCSASSETGGHPLFAWPAPFHALQSSVSQEPFDRNMPFDILHLLGLMGLVHVIHSHSQRPPVDGFASHQRFDIHSR